MSDQAQLLQLARAAHAEHRFGAANESFAQAHEQGELSANDILAWHDASWWLGHAEQSLELAELAHRRLVEAGQTTRAAKEAIGLGFLLMLRGDLATGSGWLQRGRSMLEQVPEEPSHAYVVYLDAQSALYGGDLAKAVGLAHEASATARNAADSTLLSLALMTEGTAHLRGGAVAEGMALLDEAMLPVRTGQLSPEVTGNLYCQMIAVCWELADLRRAREWTAATERWCAGFESSVMFSGICRMHRVQLQQVSGAWDAAAAGARVVCTELVGMNTSVVAEGHYLLGDLLRLRGATADAEAAYVRAHELGRDPQPGHALLTSQAGHTGNALASLKTALTAHQGADYARVPLLRAIVDLALEMGDQVAARDAGAQLTSIAERWPSDGLAAEAAHARGALQLASGDYAHATWTLREAIRRWQELDSPYSCARARMLLAEACSALDDQAAVALELDAAARILAGLGAVVDLARLQRLRSGPDRLSGLTPREAEILSRVAEGGTNKQIAAHLVISEKTVARHLANIYLKLGVSTRTAAVAWARRAGLPPS